MLRPELWRSPGVSGYPFAEIPALKRGLFRLRIHHFRYIVGVDDMDSRISGEIGAVVVDLSKLSPLRKMEEEIAAEKDINFETLRHMVAKVEEHSESHRAHGLPGDLLNILKDNLESRPRLT